MGLAPKQDEGGADRAEPSARLTPAEISSLYDEHRAELRRMVFGVLGARESVDDALQTAFAKAVEFGGPDCAESAKAWLFRVAVNEALAIRRRQKVADRALDSVGYQRPAWTDDDAFQRLMTTELVERIRAGLAALPEDERAVLRARVYENLKFREIADRLRIPLGTVLTRMRRAMDRLREELSDLNQAEDK